VNKQQFEALSLAIAGVAIFGILCGCMASAVAWFGPLFGPVAGGVGFLGLMKFLSVAL